MSHALAFNKLDESFYQRSDVTRVAKDLLGKKLFTRIGRQVTSGIIVETEAYSHVEKGCHAYLNRKTKRNEIMFSAGGYSYVYLCYGIHNLFNVVTGSPGTGDAVLIRALEPIDGIETMQTRMGATSPRRITSGPGKLTKALGIDRSFNGKHLTGAEIWIGDGVSVKKQDIVASPRIGIDYAGEDAELPWRYTIAGNIWVSKP
ncbi:MAG TPA: DNA-3-methyladenine glycosylase [Cyclobacteriaceae bacterium]|nr:DNA-3-methyladenine glycosylase [Cyclobacteriaceae bacterium]